MEEIEQVRSLRTCSVTGRWRPSTRIAGAASRRWRGSRQWRLRVGAKKAALTRELGISRETLYHLPAPGPGAAACYRGGDAPWDLLSIAFESASSRAQPPSPLRDQRRPRPAWRLRAPRCWCTIYAVSRTAAPSNAAGGRCGRRRCNASHRPAAAPPVACARP